MEHATDGEGKKFGPLIIFIKFSSAHLNAFHAGLAGQKISSLFKDHHAYTHGYSYT